MLENSITANKIANASKWSTLAEIMAKIAAPIVNMLLARLLDPEAFGVIASITIITSFADLFTDAGFQRYIIQKKFKTDEELDNYTNVSFWSNLTLSTIIFIIICLFKDLLAILVGCPTASLGIAVAATAVICTSFSSTTIARYRRSLNFKTLFFSRLISSFIPLFITVPLAFFLRNYWAMIIGTLAQQLFLALFLMICSPWKPKLYYSFELLNRMIPFSTWNLLESLSIWFAGQANVFIVANILNTYYLGLYKTAMSTVNSYMAVITASITPVLFSALSRYQDDEKAFTEIFLRFQRIISLIVLPMGAGLFVYRKFAVAVLLGEKWSEVSMFLGTWAFVSSLTITFSNVASEVYRSKGKPKISFFLQVVYMIIYIPTIIYGAKSGFMVLCFISSFIRIIPIILDQFALKFLFNINFGMVLKNTISSIIPTVCMIIIALIMNHYLTGYLWDAIEIVICIIIYSIVAYAFPSNRLLLTYIKKKRA